VKSAPASVIRASARFAKRPLAGVMAEYTAVRATTLILLRGLATTAWEHRTHEAWAMRSVRAFAYLLAGHKLHHGRDLRRYSADVHGQRTSSRIHQT
jgi:hypothetical protein